MAIVCVRIAVTAAAAAAAAATLKHECVTLCANRKKKKTAIQFINGFHLELLSRRIYLFNKMGKKYE